MSNRPKCLKCECSPEILRLGPGHFMRGTLCYFHNKVEAGLINRSPEWHRKYMGGGQGHQLDTMELPPANLNIGIAEKPTFTGGYRRNG